jgi:hypothetical protein
MARKRVLKVLSVTTSLLTSFLALRWREFGLRITTDENNVIRDIQTIFIEGVLAPPTQYFPGNSYPIMASTILKLFGADSWLDLDWIAPVVGTVSFIIICLITINIFRDSDSKMVWAAGFTPLVLWCFSGFINRLTEATHKPFTFLITFLLLYLGYRIGISDRLETRLLLIFSFLAAALSTYNYVWGSVYCTVALVVLFFTSGLKRWDIARNTVIATAVLYTVLFIPLVLPTATLHVTYFLLFVRSISGSFSAETDSSSPSAAGDEGSLAGWDTIDVFGAEISVWFFHVSGILLSTLVAAIAGIVTIAAIARGIDDQRFARVYLAIGVIYSTLVAAIIVAGDIATFKRIIVVPALFGVLYTVHYMHRSVSVSNRQRRILLSALVISFLIAAPLALPRVLLNGEIAPTDTYAGDSQVSKIEWYHGYQSDCLLTYDELDFRVSGKLSGLNPVATTAEVPVNETDSVVYTAGEGDFLTCRER